MAEQERGPFSIPDVDPLRTLVSMLGESGELRHMQGLPNPSESLSQIGPKIITALYELAQQRGELQAGDQYKAWFDHKPDAPKEAKPWLTMSIADVDAFHQITIEVSGKRAYIYNEHIDPETFFVREDRPYKDTNYSVELWWSMEDDMVKANSVDLREQPYRKEIRFESKEEASPKKVKAFLKVLEAAITDLVHAATPLPELDS